MSYTLDNELALTADGESQLSPGSELYWNGGSAFGGWVMALSAKAVQNDEEARGAILSADSRFMAPVLIAPVRLTARLVQRRKRIDFWQVDIEQDGALVAQTDIVAGLTKSSALNYQHPMPEAKPPKDSLTLEAAPPLTPVWLSAYDQHLAQGVPFQVNPSPETLLWIRDKDGRPLDALSVLAMADAPMPRSFFMADGIRLGSSVSISTYVRAPAEDFAAIGSSYVLLRCSASRISDGLFDQRVEMWAENGTLLAVSNQIAVHR